MTEPALTIVIPTFDRHADLFQNLDRVAPQLDARCRLVVVDNASPQPVAPAVEAWARAWPTLSTRTYEPGTYRSAARDGGDDRATMDVFTNALNIGGAANLLRCFEVCHSEWLWILGDDDAVNESAIRTVFEHIARFPDATFFNFSVTPGQRTESIVVQGWDQLIQQASSFATILLISVGIYRAARFREAVRLGYRHIYGGTSQFAPLYLALGQSQSCCLSSATIVDWAPNPREKRWSYLDFALGVNTLLDWPMELATRKRLARLTRESLPAPESMIVRLLLLSSKTSDRALVAHFYSALYERIYKPGGTLSDVVRWRLYWFLMKAPGLSLAVLSRAAGWFGTIIDDSLLEDRVTRM